MDEKELIRRAYVLDGQSERQIAKERNHSRNSIAAVLADPKTATYRLAQPRAAPVMDSVKAVVNAWLEADQTAPRKQRHTAHRIFERLVVEQAFQGKESTVRRFVRLRRAEIEVPEAFLLLEYSPGWDAQCDFGEAEVIVDGQATTVQLFCLRLCYSKAAFVYAFPHQRQEAFLEGQRRAFEFFGSIPHRIWYDNLKVAVQKILVGHRREEQQAFLAFRSHYLFESRFCTPGEGHEKGLVENLVGYARRNFLVPVPAVPSLVALNAELFQRCRHEETRRLHGETQTIGERLIEERGAMLQLPTHPYECCRLVPARVNRYSLITFETNRYSVPTEYAGRQVLVKAFVDRLRIALADQVIADHPRSYAREGDVLDPHHFLRLLLERPGAWEHSQAIREWQGRWPPVYDRYWAALRRQSPEPQNVREFVRILMLERTFTEPALAVGLEWALTARCFTCEGVLRHLRESMPSPADSFETSFATLPEPWAPKVAVPDLAQYQQLVMAGAPNLRAAEGPHGN